MKIFEILPLAGFGFAVFILGFVSEWLMFRKVLQQNSESRTAKLRSEKIKVIFSLGACVVLWSLYGFNVCKVLVPVVLTAFTLGVVVYILILPQPTPPKTMTKETKR